MSTKERRTVSRWLKRVLMASSLLVLAALIGLVWHQWPERRAFYTDAESIRDPARTASLRDILWQAPKLLPLPINTAKEEYEPRLSTDGLTLFFVRGKAGRNADIFTSARTRDGWGEPVPMETVNSDADELGPEPSPDGEQLFFYSDREGGFGGYDLWMSRRSREGWGIPVNLGPSVNSSHNEYGVAQAPDGSVLYLASNRPRPEDARQPNPSAWPATLREELFFRDYDLYAVSVLGQEFGQAQPLTALNTKFNEGSPAVSPVGDFLYFASDRPGGMGGYDLFRSRRLRGGHEPPSGLAAPVNSSANELDPGLSLGGFGLSFSSDRALAETRSTNEADYNLYYTCSREVFREVETVDRPPIDWAAIWYAIGPALLWTLLAILLALLLLALLGTVRNRKLSLLARCLLASMFAHLLMLMLFTMWQVAGALPGEFRRGGPIQVALFHSDAGDGIASQIAGFAVVIHEPETAVPSTDRPEPEFSVEPNRSIAKVEPVSVAAVSTKSAIESEAADALPELDRQLPTPNARQSGNVRATDLIVPLPRPERRAAVDDPMAQVPQEPILQEHARPVVEPQSGETNHRAFSVAPGAINTTLNEASMQNTLAHALYTMDSRPASPSAPPFEWVSHSLRVTDRRASTIAVPASAKPAHVRSEEVPAISAQSIAQPVDLRRSWEPAPQSDVPIAVARVAASPGTALPNQDHTDASLMGDDPEFDAPVAVTGSTPALTITKAELPQAADRADRARPVLEERKVRASETSTVHEPVAPEMDRPYSPPLNTEVVAVRSSWVVPFSTAQDSSKSHSTLLPLQVADAASNSIPGTVMRSSRAEIPRRDVADSRGIPLPPKKSAAQETDKSNLEPSKGLMIADPRPTQNRFDFPLSVERTAIHQTPVARIQRAEVPARHGPIRGWIDAAQDSATTATPTVLGRGAPAVSLAHSSPLALRTPTESEPSKSMYPQRVPEQRRNLVEKHGGSEETERAVASALKWLAEHQSPDGSWKGYDFDARCGRCGGETNIQVDGALTGLALLCFLGAGHSVATDGPYRQHVQRAVDWLLDHQGPDGDLGRSESLYSHGIATIALAEAFGVSRDERFRNPLKKAVDFLYRARSTSMGGWRYDPGQDGDTSVTGWQIMALKSARLAGVEVPADGFEHARRWLDLVSHPSKPGQYSYQPGREFTPAMTAEGMFIQQLLGLGSSDPRTVGSAQFVLRHLPDWEDAPNTYYWYYATLALFQKGGDDWRTWNERLVPTLVNHQHATGPRAGSWDPRGEWAATGGRVYQTALCALMLEVYYRYLPLYLQEKPVDSIGTIHGRVWDAATREPLPGATIRLDLSEGPPSAATTDEDGQYVLTVGEVPEHFAVSASHPGYVPEAVNVPSVEIRGTSLVRDFKLHRERSDWIALEPVPEVHHLGDNRFEGRINSQFQRRSEGDYFQADFVLSGEPSSGGRRIAELSLLAKGVQRSHEIRINGVELDDPLDTAPSDGSFGRFSAEIPIRLLRRGLNSLELFAKRFGDDIDDFEFVNVQIRLVDE